MLFWTALLLCSLLLQYMSFASPANVLAVHDVGVFELDGNAVDQAAPGDDWENGTPGAQDSLFIPGSVEKAGPDSTYFKGGGSKDENALSAWAWSSNDIAPDKDELLDVFASVYDHSGDTLVYFGADKYDDSGDAQIGYWFFRHKITLGNGDFNGSHANGDVLVLSDFTNGGGVSRICVYEWDPPGGNSAINNSAGCDLGDNLVLVASGVDCSVGDGSFDVCATVNSDTETAPWAFVNKDGETSFAPGQFYEGGINLSKLFDNNPPCFNSFLAETRSSQETDAQLKDFALGSLDTCVPPDMSTEASTHDADFGGSVTDTATLSDSHGPASGSVKFFICGPSSSYPDCSSGGDQVGGAVIVSTTANGGTATSDAFQIGTSASAAGRYCFRAEYKPDASSQYLATDHTNKTTECFKVDAPTIEISKTADPAGPVDAGDEIGFDITVTNTGTTTTLGVHVTDPLPGGVTWTADAPTGSTTGLSCSLTGSPGSQALDCTKPSLAAGASFAIHVHGTTDAADCGKVSNTASVGTSNDGSDQDSASVTVQCPDIKVTKTPDGSSINAGDMATFTIKVENVGNGTATGVTASDNLPAGVHWTESEADCSISGPDGSQVLSCDVGTLAAGASRTYSVSAVTSRANCGPIDNTVSASATNEPSDALGNNSDDGSISVLCAEIDIAKTADDGTVNAGDQIGFTITVTNNGTGTAHDVTASDTLDPAFSWSLAAPSAGWTLVGNQLAYAASSLAAGDSSSVHVIATSTPADCRVVDNTATASAGNDGSDEASATVTIQCPDLHVLKTADSDVISAGDKAAFTIIVSNDGDGTAYNATLTDVLPGGVSWSIDPAVTGCSISDGTLSCSWATLAAGATVEIHVSGTTEATNCGVLHNTVRVDADNESEADAADNSSGADVRVDCPDVKVVKTADSSPIRGGDVAAFTITVTNIGDGSAYDVTLDDPLPAGVSWSIDPAVPGCSIVNSTLSCAWASLAPDASIIIHISGETTVAACGELHNTATVGASNELEGKDANNTSTAFIVVDCPELVLTKTPDQPSVLAGHQIGFTIDVKINGVGTARGVTVTDTLPTNAGLSWSIDPAVEGCSIASGVLNCDFGDLASGATASVHIVSPTTASTCGVVDNTASVTTTNDGSTGDTSSVDVQCASIELVKTAGTAANGEVFVTTPGDVVFTYLVTNTGSADLEDLVLVDDNGTPSDKSDDVTVDGDCPTTLAAHTSMTCYATLPVGFGVRTNIATVTANPVLDSEGQVSASDDAVVRVPQLTIAKSFTGNSAGQFDGQKAAFEGDILTYTLAYDLSDGPVTDGIITDVLPEGLVYLDGTATGNDEFTFVGYDDLTRTLTWTADGVTKDGTVGYQVGVEDGAIALPQPLTNVATIDSAETSPDTDQASVVVGAVEAATSAPPRITPPPTSTIDQAPESSAGNGLLLLLVAIAGFMLVAGILVPSPARARRRTRRRG